MIVEIPITDVDRLFNRKPDSSQERLECMGLKANMFTTEQLGAIDKGCKKTN